MRFWAQSTLALLARPLQNKRPAKIRRGRNWAQRGEEAGPRSHGQVKVSLGPAPGPLGAVPCPSATCLTLLGTRSAAAPSARVSAERRGVWVSNGASWGVLGRREAALTPDPVRLGSGWHRPSDLSRFLPQRHQDARARVASGRVHDTRGRRGDSVPSALLSAPAAPRAPCGGDSQALVRGPVQPRGWGTGRAVALCIPGGGRAPSSVPGPTDPKKHLFFFLP